MGLDSHEILGRGNGWINLAKIGAAMGKEGIKITGKLMPFFEKMSDDYELYEDFTGSVKVVYLRPRNNASDGIEKRLLPTTKKEKGMETNIRLRIGLSFVISTRFLIN